MPVKVDLVSEKQSRKEDTFIAHGFDYIKIVFTLLIKVIAFYVQVFIVKIEIPSLKKAIKIGGTYLKLVIFLALNKQF